MQLSYWELKIGLKVDYTVVVVELYYMLLCACAKNTGK
jgi:hypothetical protein